MRNGSVDSLAEGLWGQGRTRGIFGCRAESGDLGAGFIVGPTHELCGRVIPLAAEILKDFVIRETFEELQPNILRMRSRLTLPAPFEHCIRILSSHYYAEG